MRFTNLWRAIAGREGLCATGGAAILAQRSTITVTVLTPAALPRVPVSARKNDDNPESDDEANDNVH